MKIAIDESGDSGRKFWRGSSSWFVVAAAIVPDVGMVCGPECQAINDFKAHHMAPGVELHFSHNSHEQHDQFFKFMDDKDYFFVAVAIDKKRLPTKLFRGKKAILQACLDKLFEELRPYWDNPIVLIDNNSRRVNRALKWHLLKMFGSHHKGDLHSMKDIVFVDSKTEPLVQLADYVAGAVHHHVDGDYDRASYQAYLQKKGKIFYL